VKNELVTIVGGAAKSEPPPPCGAVVSVLSAGVAHDFNNAITALRAVLYVAAAEAGPIASLAQGQSIVDRCSDLTRWLFSVTSGSAWPGTAGYDVVDLNSCVRDAVAVLSRSLPSSVRIQLELAEEPALVRAAPDLIAYVMVQLVQNASEALPDGGTIATRVVGRAGEHLGVIVEDAGFGMDGETLRRAFEPFFTTKVSSVGLGLSNARRVVQALGGTLTLTSTLGQGTRATVALPGASPATTDG
jgi:signal transduction histidine kinase